MQKIYFQAREVIDYFRITPAHFIYLFDHNRLPFHIIDGCILFEFHELKKLDLNAPKTLLYKEQGLATVAEALDILGISRRTFYIRVAKKEIELEKKGRRSFVKLADIDPDFDLF